MNDTKKEGQVPVALNTPELSEEDLEHDVGGAPGASDTQLNKAQAGQQATDKYSQLLRD